MRREDKSMRPRKESGSRRSALGRPREKRLRMRRRSGYTSKRSSLHGGDGKAKRSRSAPRLPIPQKSILKLVGGKQVTPVPPMTRFGDRAWMDPPSKSHIRLRETVLLVACGGFRNRRLETPQLLHHRTKTPPRRQQGRFQCSPGSLPSFR